MSFVLPLKDKINIEILSSSGGLKFHEEVSEQKRIWLKNRGLDFVTNFVPGRKLKKNFATSKSILIDDTPDVIDGFNSSGGVGILHKDVNETINRLKELL
jgi:hypothetical protein